MMYLRDEKMKKISSIMKAVGAGALMLALLTGCGSAAGEKADTASAAGQKPAAAAKQEAAKMLTMDEQVEQILSSMSETEKIGQMVFVSLPGTVVDDEARYALQQLYVQTESRHLASSTWIAHQRGLFQNAGREQL
jgi:beta-N-acetylhexosaminidase